MLFRDRTFVIVSVGGILRIHDQARGELGKPKAIE